jgi:hypothetical protein
VWIVESRKLTRMRELPHSRQANSTPKVTKRGINAIPRGGTLFAPIDFALCAQPDVGVNELFDAATSV